MSSSSHACVLPLSSSGCLGIVGVNRRLHSQRQDMAVTLVTSTAVKHVWRNQAVTQAILPGLPQAADSYSLSNRAPAPKTGLPPTDDAEINRCGHQHTPSRARGPYAYGFASLSGANGKHPAVDGPLCRH